MRPDGSGSLLPVWPNYAVIAADIFQPLHRSARTVWFPPGAGMALNKSAWIVNMCADADEYARALAWLAGLEAASAVPIFNHPLSIIATRRDTIADRLSGISGLTIPRCVRFKAESPSSFRLAFEANGFRYPVLVRPTGSQTGQHLLKIDNADEWDKIYAMPWPGQFIYMTQFVDFAEAPESYTKIRISIIGKHHMVRHAKFGNAWNVHNTSDSADHVRRELELIEQLEGTEILQRVATEVKKRIPLDFWGLDLGYGGEGKDFVFFEGNAAMSMVFDDRPNRAMRRGDETALSRKKSIGADLKRRLQQHILAPSDWIGTS